MKPMQSFLFMYYILEYCYKKCKEDHLGCFLSSIDPELWGWGRPMDEAIYDDWKEQNDIQDLCDGNIIEAVFKFIVYYEKWWFRFPETKKILSNLINDKIESEKIIVQAKEYAENMYKEYKYDD